jgi:hypothetical protein
VACSDIHGTSQALGRAGLCFAIGTAIALGGAMALISSNQANATPKFTADTKLPCTQCHTSPPGAQNLTDLGKKFMDNGNKLPPK